MQLNLAKSFLSCSIKKELMANKQSWNPNGEKEVRLWKQGNIGGKERIRQRKRSTAGRHPASNWVGGSVQAFFSEDVTLSTKEAEARMCDSAVVSLGDLSLCQCHTHTQRTGRGGWRNGKTGNNERKSGKEDKRRERQQGDERES